MRDLDHQPQVADDHTLARGTITLVGKAGETDLLFGRQESGTTDFIEIQTYRISEGVREVISMLRVAASVGL